MSWGLRIDEAARFHGHLGPWLIIGYRAGSIARTMLKPRDIHDLYCVVRVPSKTPYSCSVDGVQASASCTLGKGNIVIENRDDFEFVFTNNSTKKSIRIKLRREVLNKLKEFESIDEASRYVMGLKDWELFELS
ncbi:MAG: formylmethanofuran dehydrogenase subunit E family protein [Desulfurococcaceae archaeon]|jgi:formylmethanofuran dehydrogenase subunit E